MPSKLAKNTLVDKTCFGMDYGGSMKWKYVYLNSRHKRPRSIWSAQRFTTSGLLGGFNTGSVRFTNDLLNLTNVFSKKKEMNTLCMLRLKRILVNYYQLNTFGRYSVYGNSR